MLPPEAPIDACTLLEAGEIQAAMGEAVTETRPNRESADGFIISQCIFLLPNMTESITLRLVQRGAGEDAKDPRKVWLETFARDLEQARGNKKEGAHSPEEVPNLGDAAFWLGGPKTGGLYVLQGHRYFRLGLGGEPNQSTKIERARHLAEAILARLN